MKKLILSNIRDSGIAYIIFFNIANNIIYFLFNSVSHIYILSYSITLSYFYLYSSFFLPKKESLDSAFLLQRSLPVDTKDIITSWYITIYIINLFIFSVNVISIIIIKKSSQHSIANILLILFAYLISIINFNIVGPSMIKTFSTVSKVIYMVIAITFFIGTLIITCNSYDNLALDVISILDIIILIPFYITYKISIKKSCQKLLLKFE